jgi:DNA-binding FadR family transcriptional regulator
VNTVRALPGINTELAAAVRRVNALYTRIPEQRRPDVNAERWQELEHEIDRACKAGDPDRALRAIAAWEDHARWVLKGAAA